MTSPQEDGARLLIDPVHHRAVLDGRPLALTAQEYTVLRALCRRAVVSRDELRRAAELRDASVRRVDGILVGLRRRLGPDAIRTVRGRGWMLELPHALIDDGR